MAEYFYLFQVKMAVYHFVSPSAFHKQQTTEKCVTAIIYCTPVYNNEYTIFKGERMNSLAHDGKLDVGRLHNRKFIFLKGLFC